MSAWTGIQRQPLAPLGRDRAFGETNKQTKEAISNGFSHLHPHIHIRSTFHISKKCWHYIRDATPGIPKPMEALVGLKVANQFETQLMGPRPLKWHPSTGNYAAPPTSLGKVALLWDALTLPALGPTPPHKLHLLSGQEDVLMQCFLSRRHLQKYLDRDCWTQSIYGGEISGPGFHRDGDMAGEP